MTQPINNASFNFQKFAIFLKSFWGILAVLSAALPTILYFLKTELITESILAQYYITIPTTFSLLVIPFIFLYEDKLSILGQARKTSVVFIVMSLLLIFSFLIVKTKFVTDKYYTIYANPNLNVNSLGTDSTIGKIKEPLMTKVQESHNGKISKSDYACLSCDTPEKEEMSVNNYELSSVVLYTLSVLFTTLSFSSLGVFFIQEQKTKVRKLQQAIE